MNPIDAEIDRLFQLPLAEFITARDALAKRAGAGAATIRTLQKPNAAAWGVNQLYWQRRSSFERLVATFEATRAAQALALSGKAVDRVAVEASHRAALEAAVDEVRALLRDAGDAASASTMAAVRETLDVLPAGPVDGRLSRPLAPMGFGALAGLMGAAVTAPAAPADVVSIESGRRKARRADVADAEREERAQHEARAAEARRARIERAESALVAARVAERTARAAAVETDDQLRRAEAARDWLRVDLADADVKARRCADAAARATRDADAAAEARADLERVLREARAAR